MEKNKAIVLKTFLPYKQKLCLLDRELGKIMVVPNREHISYGSLLFYVIKTQQTQNMIYFIHSIDVIDMPLQLAKDDILFMHHVLELCYYFIPLGSPTPRIFDLILQLYTLHELPKYAFLKKIFLFQFFIIVGLHPEEEKFKHPYFHYLASASIDIIAQQPLDLVIEQALDDWLLRCIDLHPCAHNFRTVHFLHSNKIIG